MAYVDSGINLCPILSKLDVGGTDRNSVLCKCNQDGTFTYGTLDDYLSQNGGRCNFEKNIYQAGSFTSYNCEFWDFSNERCSLKTTDYLKSPDTEEDNLMVQLEKVIGKTSERDEDNSSLLVFFNNLLEYFNETIGTIEEKDEAEGTGSSLLKELNHMHGAHWHPRKHRCENIPVSCGHPNYGFASFGTPYATVLIAEFMSNQDLDGNGFIYGKDFMIADSFEKPAMVKSIELTEEWVDPDIVIDWVPLRDWSLSGQSGSGGFSSPPSAPDPLDPYR